MRNAIALDYPTSRTPEMVAGHELVLRKASMPDIHALLDLINGYAAQGNHAAAHRVRDVGEHPGFHAGFFGWRLSAAALFIFIPPPAARSDLSRWIPRSRAAESGAR